MECNFWGINVPYGISPIKINNIQEINEFLLTKWINTINKTLIGRTKVIKFS